MESAMEDVGSTAKSGEAVAAPNNVSARSAELAALCNENEHLRLERDKALLRAELAQQSKPWWRKASIVTTLTAIIAAVVPVTTAVQAHYEKERELSLEESKQAHAIRTSYLDRLDKPGAGLRTLRFVIATTSDPTLTKWAQDEIELVQRELAKIDQLNGARTVNLELVSDLKRHLLQLDEPLRKRIFEIFDELQKSVDRAQRDADAARSDAKREKQARILYQSKLEALADSPPLPKRTVSDGY